MSGIYSGGSGIIAPPNLATNGNFAINQRGVFNSGYTPAKDTDYVSDCWQLYTTTDQIEVFNEINSTIGVSGLIIKGYGKKGQTFSVAAKLNEGFDLAHHNLWNKQTIYFTAAFGVGIGSASIPVKATALASRGGTHENITYPVVMTKPDTPYELVGISKNTSRPVSTHAMSADFVLEQDGYFHVWVSNARAFAGAFKNPPKYAPVPYADDLARCQRYYQKGSFNDQYVVGPKFDTNDCRYAFPCKLETSMATTPTVTAELTKLRVYDGAGSYNDRESSLGVSNTFGSQPVDNKIFGLSVIWRETTYAEQMYTNGFHLNYSWTAEVV